MEVSIAKKSLTNLMMVAALTGGVISMNISAKETDSLVQSSLRRSCKRVKTVSRLSRLVLI